MCAWYELLRCQTRSQWYPVEVNYSLEMYHQRLMLLTYILRHLTSSNNLLMSIVIFSSVPVSIIKINYAQKILITRNTIFTHPVNYTTIFFFRSSSVKRCQANYKNLIYILHSHKKIQSDSLLSLSFQLFQLILFPIFFFINSVDELLPLFETFTKRKKNFKCMEKKNI